MTAICAAFDNIRLIRRKVRIAEIEIKDLNPGPKRDMAMLRLSRLTTDLLRALNDFAELGYEEEVAKMLEQSMLPQRQQVQS